MTWFKQASKVDAMAALLGHERAVRPPEQNKKGVVETPDDESTLTTSEQLLDYLDKAICHWRNSKEDFAKYYVDAFQSVRSSIFGKTLPQEEKKESYILDFPNYDRDDRMKGDSGCFDENAPVDRKKKIAPDPGPASVNPGGADIAPQVFE